MNAARKEVFAAICQAADRGEPLTFKDLLKFDPAAVRGLTEAGDIVEGRMRIGSAEVSVMLPAPPLPEDEDAWTTDEDEYLGVAYTSGVTFGSMTAALKRSGGEILQRAWGLKLDRPDPSGRHSRDRVPNDWTGSEIPGWRITRLRSLIEEAEARGANARDDGEGIEHRALKRRFDAARADIAAEARKGIPWEPQEDAELLRLRSEGLSNSAIARALKRNPGGVGARLSYLGMTDSKIWTEDEDRILVAGIERGLTCKRVSVMLPGRTDLAVKIRASKIVPGRGFDAWTEEEDALLRAGVAAGDSFREIARRVGRTVGGARWRGRYLGLSHPGAIDIYTLAEDLRITQGWARKDPPAEIAADIGRKLSSVYQRAFKLGVTGTYRRKITPEEIETVRRRVAQDWTGAQIAEEINRSTHMVYRIAELNGITWKRKGPRGPWKHKKGKAA